MDTLEKNFTVWQYLLLYAFATIAFTGSFTCDGDVAREVEVANASFLIEKTYPDLNERIAVLRLKPTDGAVHRSFAEILAIEKAEESEIFIGGKEQKKSPGVKKFLNLPFIKSKLGENKFEAELRRKFVDKFTTWEDPKKYPNFTKMLELMKKSETELSKIPFRERDQIFEKGFNDFSIIMETPKK